MSGELRLSLRPIARQPILSTTIILALATGICLAMVGFTFRDLLVNSTLPFQAGDRFARFAAASRATTVRRPSHRGVTLWQRWVNGSTSPRHMGPRASDLWTYRRELSRIAARAVLSNYGA